MSAGVDRELSLAELLPTDDLGRLCASVGMLLGVPVALVDEYGQVLAGALGLAEAGQVPLVVEIEAIGYLRAPGAPPVAVQAAAVLLRQILIARARYLMAASVHRSTVEADYEELQRQNAALKASEANYRTLAEELEARVAAQVKIIDERQRQLYQAERLASVGELAAGVAHEINNPIGFVRSNLNTARGYAEKIAALGKKLAAFPGGAQLWAEAEMDFLSADLAELVGDSIGGIDRVARIVADLKGFSSVDQPEEAVADINAVLAGACGMAEKKLPAGATLVRRFGTLTPQMCLPGHLAQAFLAILTNAAQAISARAGDGCIEVDSEARGTTTVVRIRDNGTGIAANALPRVFDPFFTTRPVGQGTGLGLTVARDIVRTHGGDITLDSTPGVGTVVTVTLPD